MKVASFNINNVERRLANLLAWLKRGKPDVVCLQELKRGTADCPDAELRKARYRGVWHGQRTYNGVAILARDKEPVPTRRGLPGDGDDAQSRYIEAAVNGVLIASVYAPNGNPQPVPKFDYKLAWLERLITRGAELLAAKVPVVMCGDFNVIPTDLDVYKPERWLTDALFRPESREAFQRLMSQGWTDALRSMYPDQVVYTFWDYFRNAFGRDAGIRIDHLLLSPALAPALRAAGVDRFQRAKEKPSDHAPTWVELDMDAVR